MKKYIETRLIFFLIIDLNLLIPAAIAQIFNPIAELLIPIGIQNKEAKAEIEIHPIIVEAKIRKCSVYLELYKPFCAFIHSFCFISSRKCFPVLAIFFI